MPLGARSPSCRRGPLPPCSESVLHGAEGPRPRPQGVVKFAQVVGVFPGPKFDDAEGLEDGWRRSEELATGYWFNHV